MVKKCCFCIKLRRACIIIAIVDFIINLVVLNLAGRKFGADRSIDQMITLVMHPTFI